MEAKNNKKKWVSPKIKSLLLIKETRGNRQHGNDGGIGRKNGAVIAS